MKRDELLAFHTGQNSVLSSAEYTKHHRQNFAFSTKKQTPEHSEGQGSLGFCNPWGHKESDMTEQLNNNNVEDNQ